MNLAKHASDRFSPCDGAYWSGLGAKFAGIKVEKEGQLS